MVKRSEVLKFVKEKNFRTSKDVMEALTQVITNTLVSAIASAEADKRKTIAGKDILK